MSQDSEKHESEPLGNGTKDLVSMQIVKSALEREGERGGERKRGREGKESEAREGITLA